VSRSEAEKLAAENTINLLSQQKLALVLDLDQTLIHATTEQNVKQQPLIVNGSDIIEFTLPPNPTKYYVKLR
jgi:RNA polymerase II subunit A-like phosphatase